MVKTCWRAGLAEVVILTGEFSLQTNKQHYSNAKVVSKAANI